MGEWTGGENVPERAEAVRGISANLAPPSPSTLFLKAIATPLSVILRGAKDLGADSQPIGNGADGLDAPC